MMRLFILLFLFSCEGSIFGEPGELKFESNERVEARGRDGDSGQNLPVTFRDINVTFIKNKCAGCHSNSFIGDYRTEKGFLEAIDPGNPQRSKAYIRVDNGSMPPSGRLPQEEIDLLEQYILEIK